MHEHIPAEEELVDDGNPREPNLREVRRRDGMGDCYEIDCEDGSYAATKKIQRGTTLGEWVKCRHARGRRLVICVRCSPEIDHS